MSAALEPLWLTETEEREELAKVVGHIGQRSPAEIDAAASEYLGAMRQCDEDLKRYADAEEAEIARVKARYHDAGSSQLARSIVSLKARRDMLEGAVRALADMQDFGPKKKSRETANGIYGRKEVPAHVFVDDKELALAWAEKQSPDLFLVTYKTTASFPQKHAQQHYEATGEIPDGCRVELAHTEPFARPHVDSLENGGGASTGTGS